MNHSDIAAAFEERQRVVADLRALADEAEGREFTAEETEVYERHNAAIDGLDSRIQTGLSNMEREAKATEALETFRAYNAITTPATEAAVDPKTDDETLMRQLLIGEIRTFTSDGVESRDLTVGTGTAGGNLVTSTLYQRVIDKIEESGAAIRAGATVIQTASGEDMLIPTVTSHTTGALVAEGGTIGESDPAFGQATLSVYKYGAIVDVSSELAADQGVGTFNVVDWVGDQGGAAVGRALSAHLTTGSGSSQPQGFDNATTGVTAASATAVTTDELIDLQHSIIAPYRGGASWVMNDSTAKAIRKLKDSNGVYVWAPGLVGTPDTLLGNPVHTDTNMAAMATGNTSIVYGDFSQGYFVRFAGGVRVEQTNADKFTTDLISVRFIVRGGGVLTDTAALRKLVQA